MFGGERLALLARELTKTFETLKGCPGRTARVCRR